MRHSCGRHWGVGIYAVLGAVVSFVGFPTIFVRMAGADWAQLSLSDKLVFWMSFGAQGAIFFVPLGAVIGLVLGLGVDRFLDHLEQPTRSEEAASAPPAFGHNSWSKGATRSDGG